MSSIENQDQGSAFGFGPWFYHRIAGTLPNLESLEEMTPDALGNQLVIGIKLKTLDLVQIERLIELGANLNTCDGEWRTPLHFSVMRGDIVLVQLLVEAGANLEAKNSEDRTPIFFATEPDKKNILNILLEHGADVTVKDCFEQTVLDFANNNQDNEDIINILKTAGAR